MQKQFELLAPGGDIESVKAAIVAGADAVYCGLDKFNARNRADNLDWDALMGLIRLAHQHQCAIFLTLNIMLLPSEFRQLWALLNRLQNSNIDGEIVQDLGLFGLLKRHFPHLPLHASTQANTHNWGQMAFLAQFGVERVNLARELSLAEIRPLAAYGKEQQMQIEVFVHGSYCVGFSGLCYLSSQHNGASGNRGRCAQPCRDAHQPTANGWTHPLNMKDNSAYHALAELAEAGVYSFKIEGRIKKSHYVYATVQQWRQQLDRYLQQQPLATSSTLLHTVFNRGFSSDYLHGQAGPQMFIDDPRDHSAHYFARAEGLTEEADIQPIKQRLYQDKTKIIQTVKREIAAFDLAKIALRLELVGQQNTPLHVILHRQDQQWHFASASALFSASKHPLDEARLQAIFNPLNDADHHLQSFDLTALSPGLGLNFAELSQLRQQLQMALRNGKPLWPEVALPSPPAAIPAILAAQKTLAVLLSEAPNDALWAWQQAQAAVGVKVDFYCALPETLADDLPRWQRLFTERPQLGAHFPAVLIGAHFEAVHTLLQQAPPAQLITNNSGVAYLAEQLGLPWVAGQQWNLSNGYGFNTLSEQPHCRGGFVSNELNQRQLERIHPPAGLALYYPLYQPQALLISRQCLLQQVLGCKKKTMTRSCLRRCTKSATLVNRHGQQYRLVKRVGDHNVLYGEQPFFNPAALTELPSISHLWVDLRAEGDERQAARHAQRQARKRALNPAFQPITASTPARMSLSRASAERRHTGASMATPASSDQRLQGLQLLKPHASKAAAVNEAKPRELVLLSHFVALLQGQPAALAALQAQLGSGCDKQYRTGVK